MRSFHLLHRAFRRTAFIGGRHELARTTEHALRPRFLSSGGGGDGGSDDTAVDERRSVVIVGSGPAGYTAALYAARAMLSPLVLAGNAHGGQLMLTSDVENFPGYAQSIGGPEMMADLRQQAERFGAEVRERDVACVDLSRRPFRLEVSGGATVSADALIIATGAEATWLDAAGEAEVRGRGVSTCATCDGALYKGRDVLVVGGGDSAMEEALFLTRFASSVTVVHRSDRFRASRLMLDRARAHPKIELRPFRRVQRWLVQETAPLPPSSGDAGLGGFGGLGGLGGGAAALPELVGAMLEDPREPGVAVEPVACAGAFIAVGHTPCSSFLAGQLEADEDGYVLTSPEAGTGTMASVEGVFACGDVVDRRYRQAITAAASGCAAAMDAERWLAERE